MFFKNKKLDNIQVAPLNYWEESSYFLVLLQDNQDVLTHLINRVSKIKGVKIVNEKFETDNGILTLILSYEKEEYEVGFYLNSFTLPPY